MGFRGRFLCQVVVVLALGNIGTACTDVVVGREASVDGSVITSQTADEAFYDARIRFVPGGSHADRPGG